MNQQDKPAVEQRCTVCGMAEVGYRSRLLGTDDGLCFRCFLLWYDEGITSRDVMRAIRVQQGLMGEGI